MSFLSTSLIIQLKVFGKEQTYPQTSRRKKIIKITVKIKYIEKKKKSMNSWFFKMINKLGKLLDKLIKRF